MTQPQPREDRSIAKAGAPPPATKRSTLRRALTRGMITAVACVVAGAVSFGIWGGLFGYRPAAAIYGGAPPGWSGAATLTIVWMVFAGPPVALAGFVAGFLVTPMRSLLSSGQVSKAIGWALLIAAGGFLAFTWYRRGSIPPTGGLLGLLGAVGGYLIGRGGDSRSPPPT